MAMRRCLRRSWSNLTTMSNFLVAKAIGKAILYWILVYVALIHCFVVWKLQSPPLSPPLPVSDPTGARHHDANAAVDVNIQALQAQHQVDMQLLGNLLQQLYYATTRVQEQRLQLEMTSIALGDALQAVQQFHVPRLPRGTTNVTLLKLEDMLQSAPSLNVYTSTSKMSRWLQFARADLQRHVELADTLDWANVTALFRSALPSKDMTADVLACIEPLATTDDWYELELHLRRTLSQRPPFPIPLLHAARRQQVEQHVQARLQEWKALQVTRLEESGLWENKNDDESAQSDGCLKQLTEVLPWMEAALNAMHRHRDVREALLQQLALDGVDMSRIILDAVLVDEDRTDDAQDHERRHYEPVLTLRTLLDQAWCVHGLGKLLDQVPDLVGGHIDWLDRWLDGLSPTPGQDAMVRLLQHVGHVPLPLALSNKLRARTSTRQ